MKWRCSSIVLLEWMKLPRGYYYLVLKKTPISKDISKGHIVICLSEMTPPTAVFVENDHGPATLKPMPSYPSDRIEETTEQEGTSLSVWNGGEWISTSCFFKAQPLRRNLIVRRIHWWRRWNTCINELTSKTYCKTRLSDKVWSMLCEVLCIDSIVV